MAELTEDGFRGAEFCAVVGEIGCAAAAFSACGTGAGDMIQGVVFFVGGGCGAVGCVVGAVPVVFPFRGGFLEDGVAGGTGDVVAEAEVLV